MDTWADEMPLYIWARGGVADLAPIKEAKLALDIREKVMPRVVGPVTPPPANARVLAIGTRPPWICDYILISEDAGRDEWEDALGWCLNLPLFDITPTWVIDTIRAIFPGAIEISPEDLEAERRMREYVQGLV